MGLVIFYLVKSFGAGTVSSGEIGVKSLFLTLSLEFGRNSFDGEAAPNSI